MLRAEVLIVLEYSDCLQDLLWFRPPPLWESEGVVVLVTWVSSWLSCSVWVVSSLRFELPGKLMPLQLGTDVWWIPPVLHLSWSWKSLLLNQNVVPRFLWRLASSLCAAEGFELAYLLILIVVLGSVPTPGNYDLTVHHIAYHPRQLAINICA